MRRPLRPPRCRDRHCGQRLNRDEALYNGGFCEKCVQENIEKNELEAKETRVNKTRATNAQSATGYDPQSDCTIRN